MIVAVVVLAIALAASLALNAWLTYGRSADAKQILAMDDERDKAVQQSARDKFELDAKTEKLAEAERTIDALAKEPREKPNADLDKNDVLTRVRRAAQRAREERGSADAASSAIEDIGESRK